MPRLQRTSTADQLVQLLRQTILSGEFLPGSALPEVKLSRSAGVSRNTLREAMRVLAAEGLVRRTMNCGVTVADLTDEDVTEIFRVRMLLELQAVKSVNRLTNWDFSQFTTSIEKLRSAMQSRQWAEVVEQDMQFHRQIVKLLQSSRLERFHWLLLSELRISLALLDRTHEKSARVVTTEHQAILDLLTSGKGESCARLLAGHLAEAEYRLRGALRARPNGRSGLATRVPRSSKRKKRT
jgi:DNA-binding GntR family transcriptional regulator